MTIPSCSSRTHSLIRSALGLGLCALVACSGGASNTVDVDASTSNIDGATNVDGATPSDGAAAGDGATNADGAMPGDASANGDAAVIATDSFAGRAVAALCDYATRCPLGELGVITDEDACRDIVARGAAASSDFGSWRALALEEANDAIAIDETNAAACIAAIETAACSDALGRGDLSAITACENAVEGRTAAGGACIASEACASGFCEPTSACEGTCRVPLGEGAPCVGGECDDGLVCAPKPGSGKVCQAFKSVGGACDLVPCEPGLVCARASGGSGGGETPECMLPPSTVGANCAVTGRCGGTLTCVDTRPAPTCVAYPGAGAACLDGYLCTRGHFCDFGTPTPTCAALGDGTNGGVCFSGSDCNAAHWCERGAFSGFCRPRLANGAACEATPEACGANLGCIGAFGSRTCQPLPSSGACADGRCATGFACSSGMCEPIPSAGLPCLAVDGGRFECESGAYCAVVADALVCATIPRRDEPCDSVCDDGLVCAEVGGARRCSEPTPLPGPGDECVSPGLCADGARCVSEEVTPTTFVCMQRPRLGEACPAGVCAPSLRCESGVCAAPVPAMECSVD